MKTARLVRSVLLMGLVLLIIDGFLHASPAITDFSSTGGKTQNKTGPKDRMYLVKPGDKITFGVKAEGAEKYVWQVNKKTHKDATGESFVWTVPSRKGIWEIHLNASGGGKEAHQEWVVSTLSKTEAPEFFEYFADGRYSARQETDPWERSLKEWKAEENYDLPHVGRCWMEPGKGGQKVHALRALSKTAYGTWRFRFRFPMGYFIPPGGGGGPRTCLYYDFIGGSTGHMHQYNKVSDAHNYFYSYRPWISMDEDSGFAQRRGWYTVTIIRRKDGWFHSYITDTERGRRRLQFRGYNPSGDDSTYIRMGLRRPLWDIFPKVTVYVDGLEIYEDKYLYPPKSARYTRYIENWRWENKPYPKASRDYMIDLWKNFKIPEVSESQLASINKRHALYRIKASRLKEWRGKELRWMGGTKRSTSGHHPVYGKGIVVQGRGVTPADVARMVNDPALIRFDKTKKAWICYTDLVVDEGAELIIKDTTLRMHCTKPGEHKIAVMYGSTMRIENSTITSDTPDYFLWRFTGTANYSFNLGMETGMMAALAYGSFGSFFAEDSTIDNCAYMFLDSLRQLRLKNVRLLRLHEADAGEYSSSGGETAKRKEFVRGKKAFCVFIKNYDVFEFDLSGVKFSGAQSPVAITFLLNSEKNRFNVYDSDFGKEKVVVRPSVRMKSFWNSNWPGLYRSELGMVNCRFGSIEVSEKKAAAVPKYYLDVKVTAGGRPVKGAKVTVRNEVDNANYPPENTSAKYRYVKDNPQLRPSALYLGQPLGASVTTAAGQTPLPADREHTIVLCDFLQNADGKKEFKYTITVEADGKKKIITGVNPGPQWYRPDPNKPTQTITVVLDGK